MPPSMNGKYIHLDDLKDILAKSGITLSLDGQDHTRRLVEVAGTPVPSATTELTSVKNKEFTLKAS